MEIQAWPAHKNNYSQGRGGEFPHAIVQHISMGTLAATLGWFQNNTAGVSSHYVIAPDGMVYQCVDDDDTAYANGNVRQPNTAAVPWLDGYRGNPNRETLTIEWIGAHRYGRWAPVQHGGRTYYVWQPRDNGLWWEPTEQQYQAGLQLNAMLADRHDIPTDRAHIIRHSDIDAVAKSFCPGAGFPMKRLLEDLNAGSGVTVPFPPLPPVPPVEWLHVDMDAARAKPITVKGPPSISPSTFASILWNKDSPAEPEAQALYRTCVRNYVDPAVALAFFGKESSFGTDPNGLAVRTRNWGNLVADRSMGDVAIGSFGPMFGHMFRLYRTWTEGLEDFCRLWNHPIYQNKSLHEQLAIYAPADDNNDPDSYANTVIRWVTAWRDDEENFSYEAP